MTSRQNRQCPKRPSLHRPCLDSLRIPILTPCVPLTLSKPSLCFPSPCIQSPGAMKYPVCACDQNFCAVDVCCSCTNCRRSSSSICQHTVRNGSSKDSKCFDPCRQQGGCQSTEENELDIPCSRESSGNEQQNIDEITSNNVDGSRSPVCPLSYSPLTNPNVNATPNYSIGQRPTADMQNIPNNECMKSCQYRPPTLAGVTSKLMISKPGIVTRSIPNIQNVGSNMHVQTNASGRNFRNTESLTDSEACCVGNRVSTAKHLSRLPQSTHYLGKIPSSMENFQYHPDESENSRDNACCRQDYYKAKPSQPQAPDDQSNFYKRQEYNDQQTNPIRSSKTNINSHQNIPINETSAERNLRQGYDDFKHNLLSTGTEPDRNSTQIGTFKSLRSDDPLQNTLNMNSVDNICETCKNTSRRASIDKAFTSRSKPYIDDGTDNEYHEPYHPGLSSATGSLQGTSKHLKINENQRINSNRNVLPNSCCIRDETDKGGMRISTPIRQPAFMNPSIRNMLPRNKTDYRAPTQEQSNVTLRRDECCEENSSRPNPVNMPNDNIKSNFSSDYKIRAQNHAPNQKSSTQNFGQKKGSKINVDCCSHGISKLIPHAPERQLKHMEDIDCVCSETIKGLKNLQCKKRVACVHDVGAKSCASTSCVVNQTSGCHCRYPPAFKQFSCTGNINGSCNCNDDN